MDSTGSQDQDSPGLVTTTRAARSEAEDLLERGTQYLEASEYVEALEILRRAHGLDPDNARIQSHLGLATARVGRAFEEARSLCEEASKREYDNPDLYVNLAMVYLGVGRRSEALRYLRRGQMIDPNHEVIRLTLREMGRRRPALIRFLPRRHWLNRVLGSVRGGVTELLTGRIQPTEPVGVPVADPAHESSAGSSRLTPHE